MRETIIHTTLLAVAFLTLFAVAEILYHYLKVKAEITRKLVHFGTGLLTLLFPVLLDDHWPVLFLCGSFAIILILSMRFNFLKSINAIDRASAGSICYPLAVYVCYLAFYYYNKQYVIFYVPILILAICDPVAALTGKRWPKGKFKIGPDNKTLLGTCMFVLSCFMLTTVLYGLSAPPFKTSTLAISASLAILCAFSEAISPRGYDNLTIPFTALAILIAFNELNIA